MEVDNAARKPTEEAQRQNTQPAGEHDEVGVEPGDKFGESGVVIGAIFVLVPANVNGGDAGVGGALQSEHVSLVGDNRYHSAVDATIGAGIENCLEI